MDNLFPEEDIELEEEDILSSEDEEESPNYQPGYKIDGETKDFVLNSSGKLIESDSLDAWIEWCKKCVETPRYQCIAYSDDYGIDVEGIMQCATQEEREDMIIEEISEALAADPYNRTSFVESVEIFWDADSVYCTVHVVGNDGSNVEINAEIAMGG